MENATQHPDHRSAATMPMVCLAFYIEKLKVLRKHRSHRDPPVLSTVM